MEFDNLTELQELYLHNNRFVHKSNEIEDFKTSSLQAEINWEKHI